MVVVFISQNSPILIRNIRMFRREMRSLTRGRFSAICNKFGHFVINSWSNKVSIGEEANISRGDSDDEHVILMGSNNVGGSMVNWYMDIGY